MKLLKKIREKFKNSNFFLVGGLLGSARIVGKKETYLMVLKMAWSYKRTMLYLLRKKGIKTLLNFLYVKIFVPVGEGAGGFFYFLFGNIIRKYPFLAPYPRYIEVEVSTICNLKCNMCEHTYWSDQEKKHLTFKEFKTIIDQFPNLKWINATGEGSAFLNKDYIAMLDYLKKKNVIVYFVDHLLDIDTELARQLINLGIDGIYVSIDGATKKTYENIRIGANFDEVIRNLTSFVRLKKEMKSPIPELCFRYVIQKSNVHEISEFIELLDSIGKRLDFGDGSSIHFTGLLDFKETRHLCVDDVSQQIIDETLKKSKEYGLHVLFQHTLVKSSQMSNPSINLCLCWMESYIMMGGYVLPCCQVLMSNKRTFLRKHSFGNVYERPFKEIWNSERYREFRKQVNNPKGKIPLFCVKCRAFDTKERETRYGIDPRL